MGASAKELVELLSGLVSGGVDSCIKGTPMIPLHRDTVASILGILDRLLGEERGPPRAICGHPIPGWRLDAVHWDERQGQPDGWIVSLKREHPDWRAEKRSFVVMARSDLGPLEAWDEALKIALREDAREAARAEARSAKESA
jgi:hypothetical protein